MSEKYKPGSVMSQDSHSAIAAPPPCKHLHLIPLEFGFAKVTYPNGYTALPDYDYATTLMAANICRVKLYYCLDCHAEIQAPKRKE